MSRHDTNQERDRPDTDEISLSELFEIVRRYAVVIGVAMAVVGSLTWWLMDRRPETFTSQARLLATQPDPAIASFSSSVATGRPLDGTAYRAAALSRPLLTAASEELARAGYPDIDLTSLDDHLTVTATEARLSIQITITVRSDDPQTASFAANAIADELVRWDSARAAASVARVTEALARQIADVDAQIAAQAAAGDEATVAALMGVRSEAERNQTAARLAASTIAGNLDVLEPAIAANEPDPTRSALIGLLAAIVVGFGLLVLTLLREALSNKLGGIDGVANMSRRPVLGSFPNDPSGSRRLPPEAAGYVRTNLQFLVPPDHPLVLLVTSGVSGEGKTSVAAALAEAYARNDYRTAIVDADGRRPRLTSTLRATGVGTRSWLRDGEPDPSAAVTVTMGRHRSLDVFGLGAPLSGEDCRVIGRAFGHLIDRLKDRYDVVIVDSAPVLPVADTLALAPQTSAVINVVSLKEATRHSLRDTLAVLDLVGANVVGVVATHAPHKHPRGSGSYGYGYGYGDETSDAIATPATGGTDRTIDRSRVKNGQASLKEPHGPRERAHARRSEPKHDESVDDLLLIDDSMVPTDWRGQGPSAPQANLGADRSEPNRQLASRDHR